MGEMNLERLAYLVHYVRYHNHVNYIAAPQKFLNSWAQIPFLPVCIWLRSSGSLVPLPRLVARLEKIRRESGVIFSSLKDSKLGLCATKPLLFSR